MNKDIDRENSTQIVSSKYFSTQSAMDESLSDFQEPKKLTGLKNASKKTKPDKPKRAPKRIRGQKDIRTALKSKKNELESYSKDFDHVCRQAGLDVDSEQLQLAIALSKSLQQSATNPSGNPETSQSLSSQDRAGKIRTTLLEYGFKVPKIEITNSRRIKKRKHYKLLITSEEAKKQIIADKYSQVLFKNITLSKNSQVTDVDNNHIHLYNLATSATYSILKSIDTFYVAGLLEKSLSTSNLLRDWSEIPGRPVSPKFSEPTNMNFSEIECSQDELDIVLSGSLKSCKNIINIKVKESNVSFYKFNEQKEQVSTSSLDNSLIVLIDDKNSKSNDGNETLKSKEIGIMDLEKPKVVHNTNDNKIINLEEPIATVHQYRSCSPDLFDDEPTVIDDTNPSFQAKDSPLHQTLKEVLAINPVMYVTEHDKSIIKESYSSHAKQNSQLSKNTNSIKFNDFMEITECVDVQCVDTDSTSTLKLPQNLTKRMSNDYMEITNCVASPVRPPNIEADVDLTQSPVSDKFIDAMSGANITVEDNLKAFNNTSKNLAAEVVQVNIDDNSGKVTENLASKHSSNRETPILSGIEESNIDLTKSPELANIKHVESMADKSIQSMDLTQSSNTSEELPFVSLKNNNNAQTADDTIIMDPKEYESIEKSAILLDDDDILDLTQNISREEINHGSQESMRSNASDPDSTQNSHNPEDILDLTQEILITSRHDCKTSDTNISFFEDYVHDHSNNHDEHGDISVNFRQDVVKDTSLKNIISDIILTKSASLILNEKQNESDDIDLTQNSGSSEEINQNTQNNVSSITTDNCTESTTENDATIETEIGKSSQDDIDLTQHSESEELDDVRNKTYLERDATNEIIIVKTSQRCSSLGKKDNVSIDYDELYDNLVSRHSDSQQSRKSSKSETDHNLSNVSSKSKDISNCSQNSEVFVISDNELDYSMHQSKLEKPVDNFIFGGLSIMDELSVLPSFRRSTNKENNSVAAMIVEDKEINQIEIDHLRKTPVKHKRVNELATPQKPGCSGINTVVTPSNSEYVIKTVDVTPMPKYESMSLDELRGELDKFGVKPFKRKRAVQLLTHIYNQTHPTVEPCSDEESPRKRRKINYDSPQKQSPRKLTPKKILAPKKTAKSPRNVSETNKVPKKGNDNTKEKIQTSKESNGKLNNVDVVQSSKNYEVNETPVIKEVESSPDDWVFQKREKAKVHSCRVPLHIAFHNYVSSRRELREAILCYEPINIDDVHKDLVAYGHRYDPKDLLKFMDKKCITVKTTDNDARNQKR